LISYPTKNIARTLAAVLAGAALMLTGVSAHAQSAGLRQDIGGVSASSSQDENPPLHAFDSDPKSRWCAVSSKFPQWIQADLGQARRVDRTTLSWERTTETYRCRIVGSTDGQHWVTLYDASKGHGVGSGTVSLHPQTVRYVRLLVLGSSASGWASLWEISIKYLEKSGQETGWQPPRPG
jgi:hypothetical protein